MSDHQTRHHVRRHIIIGDGVTAAAFAENCSFESGDELIVIGKNAAHLGRGLAYAAEPKETPWRFAYLLNSPAEDIDPNFGLWLEENWENISAKMQGRRLDWLAAAQTLVSQGDIKGLNVPRAFLGDFIEERTRNALAKHKQNGLKIQLINNTAIAIEKRPDGFRIETTDGRYFDADTVDIATGGPETQRIDGDESAFSAPTLFGNEERIAEHIKKGSEILCIGMNATMLDVLRLCQSLLPENQIRLAACSPRGSLPEPLIPQLPRKIMRPNLKGPYETAESFLAAVKENMKAARKDGHQMGELRSGFRAYFIEHGLKHFMPNIEEARKVPNTLRHWLRGGTRDTIMDFKRLSAIGSTKIICGGVHAIEPTASGAEVIFKDNAGVLTRRETGFVINCSGAGSQFTFDPLTRSLIDRGWVKVCTQSGGIEVGKACCTTIAGLRHLSPATTVIGDEVMPMPLYDAHLLRTQVFQA